MCGRFGYSDLNEAAFVRGARYGISIDFGLELIGKKSTYGASFKSKFIDPTLEAKLESPHRNARQTILQGSWSRISDAVRFARDSVRRKAASFKSACGTLVGNSDLICRLASGCHGLLRRNLALACSGSSIYLLVNSL